MPLKPGLLVLPQLRDMPICTYLIGGDLIFIDNDCDTLTAAYIMKGTAPRTLCAGRDAARDPYCRFFTALQSISSGRSDSFKDALVDASTPADEIVEYVINTWMLLVQVILSSLVQDFHREEWS